MSTAAAAWAAARYVDFVHRAVTRVLHVPDDFDLGALIDFHLGPCHDGGADDNGRPRSDDDAPTPGDG